MKNDITTIIKAVVNLQNQILDIKTQAIIINEKIANEINRINIEISLLKKHMKYLENSLFDDDE